MLKLNSKQIAPSIILSILFHILFYGITNNLLKVHQKNISASPKKKFLKNSIRIIPRKKIRTVGIKKGTKDIFTDPILTSSQKKILTLSDLTNSTTKQTQIHSLHKNPTKSPNEENEIRFLKKYRKRERKNRQYVLRNKIINSLKFSNANKTVIRNKTMNANIEVPKGITIDELNKLELVFYAFYKRVYGNIMSSLIRNINRLSRSNPALLKSMNSSRHSLLARVTYDYLGNIIAIKIIKSSQDDQISYLFEKIITTMNGLNNPPKLLINENKEFSINYRLKIN